MELTAKGIAALVIPAIVVVSGNAIDNSMKWRAELEQKKYDRQIRILDKILEIPQAEHRIASAEFYLKTNTFNGQYRQELEISLELARHQLAEQIANKQKEEQRLASYSPPHAVEAIPEPTSTADIPNEVYSEAMSEVTVEAIPEPAPEVVEETLPAIGPKTIFSYDQKTR